MSDDFRESQCDQKRSLLLHVSLEDRFVVDDLGFGYAARVDMPNGFVTARATRNDQDGCGNHDGPSKCAPEHFHKQPCFISTNLAELRETAQALRDPAGNSVCSSNFPRPSVTPASKRLHFTPSRLQTRSARSSYASYAARKKKRHQRQARKSEISGTLKA